MFNKKIHKRIKIVLLIIIFCFILIIGKVFYIQVIDYDKLNNLANNLWSRNLIIGANRGRIITSDNITIADNLTTVSLVVIPNQIKDKDAVIRDLSKILNVDESKISEHVKKRSSVEIIHPEGRQLSFEIADKINALNHEGVYLLKEGKRYYPYNNLFSHSIGYVGIDNQGLSGLELSYDEYLTGQGGSIQYYSDAKGQRLNLAENYIEPQNGMDIVLTVNHMIQESVERELSNAMKKYNADGAWAIAMNPNNGEILALASYPNFDPNNYQDYSIEEINRNLAIWSSYEPGSTFKIVTLSAALEEGLVDQLFDTQSFDLTAAESVGKNEKHVEVSADFYASIGNKSAAVNKLDFVILSALEIDTDFNVNVISGSDGVIRAASGGHSDTAAMAKISILTAPLTRGRLSTIIDKVTTVVTPGSTVDVVVTDYGVTVNPTRTDLLEKFKVAGLPLITMEELRAMATRLVGTPKDIEFTDEVVAVVEYRDGSVIDTIKKVK